MPHLFREFAIFKKVFLILSGVKESLFRYNFIILEFDSVALVWMSLYAADYHCVINFDNNIKFTRYVKKTSSFCDAFGYGRCDC